jgi:hypothetical protein
MPIITGAGIALERLCFGEAEEVTRKSLKPLSLRDVRRSSRLLQQFLKAAAPKS